jgi:ferredoxin-nitrite reductase
MGHFQPEDPPRQVINRVREQAAYGWQAIWSEDGALAVAKLRLVGVYDDRQNNCFMLRIRIPGGQLTWQQAAVIGQIAQECSRKPSVEYEGPECFVELTTRQDVQIHWLRFEALPAIWDRLESVGLTSLQACGDTARNVTSCPVAGIDPDAVLDTSPILREVNQYLLETPGLGAFLPRKFKITITGCPTDCVLARINDLAFTPACREGTLGFHIWAGGGLSDYPRLASNLGLFVRPPEVVAVVGAFLRLYQDLGDPVHKAVNRFRALTDALGPDRLRAELLARLPFVPLDAGKDLSTWRPCDHLGVHRQIASDLFYVGLNVPVGRLSADELIEVARLVRDYGDGQIRLTQRQNLILTGITAEGLMDLRREPLLHRLRPEPNPFERAVVACTSAPFCKFGIFNVKEKGVALAEYLRATVPGSTAERLEGLRLNLSGCKASCAQTHIGHLGLRATMGKDADGYHEAFDVAAGGDLSRGCLASWIAYGVPVDRVFRGISALLEAYATEMLAGETFESYLERQSTDRLAAFFTDDPPSSGASGASSSSRDSGTAETQPEEGRGWEQ